MKKYFLLLVFLTSLFLAPTVRGQGESYSDVMVIVNDSSWHSRTIGNYFASRRDIPLWHICHIKINTSETIDSLNFLKVKWRMEAWMRAGNLTDSINYIVTTKGCPLRVRTVQQDNEVTGPYSGQASFEDCVALMNGSDSTYILTPKYQRRQSRYYGANYHFQRNSLSMPFYLVTRLDAYTLAQVQAMIRSAEAPVNPTQGLWELDMDPTKEGNPGLKALNDYMRRAEAILRTRGLNVQLDSTTTYLHGRSNVIGYASWGSNDSYSGGGYAARPQNTWVNGSLAETYVSTSGRTFRTPGYGQSLIADIIAEGVSAVKGYTDEPYATSMAHIDILLDRYTSGYTMAESFYAASIWTAWRQVVIGDPKMKLYMPVISVTGSTTFCEDDSVVLTAPSGYARQTWSTGDTARSIIVRASGSYTVTMRGSLGYAATSPAVVVTVNPRPSLRITPSGTVAICQGDSIVLDAGGGHWTYRWSTGDTTRTVTAKTTGGYNVTVTNSYGCRRSSDSTTVIVRPRPEPTITPLAPTTFCYGDSVVLDAGAGYASYRWTTGDTTRKLTVRGSGAYRITVTNQYGCSRESDSIVVTANPRPKPRVIVRGGRRQLCRGEAVVLESDSAYGSYRWTTGDTTRSITVRESGDYSLSVTNQYGCPARSDTTHIQVDDLPDATITGPQLVCLNSTATYSVANASDVSYNWLATGAGASIVSGEFTSTITVKWKSAGAGTVTLRAIDNASGCQSDAKLSVNVGSALVPVVRTSRSPRLCPGESIELSADSGYVSYRWSTGATTRTITLSKAGSYTVAVADREGCSGTSTPVVVSINTPPAPVIVASGRTSICAGEHVMLDAGAGYRRYVWSNGATTRIISVGEAGNFMVTVEDSAGCSGASQPITVTSQPLPSPRIEGPDAVCSNSRATYGATGSAYGKYEWTVNNGTITGGANDSSITVEWPASGSGIVRLHVTSGGGCRGNAEPYVVTIGTSLHPALTPSGSLAICAGDSATISAPAGYATYLWSTGATSRSISVREAGVYSVSVSDAGGCRGTSDPVTVSVHAAPRVTTTPGGTITICAGDSTRIEAAPGFASYVWSTGEKGRSITVMASGEYRVTVRDSGGCQGISDAIRLVVYPVPSPPEIVANGDTLIASQATAYQWYMNGGKIPDAVMREHLPESQGRYSVRIIDSNGCSALSAPFDYIPPPPPVPSATVGLPTISASPGEHVLIPLKLISSHDLDRAGRHTFTATIRLDAAILIPVDSAHVGVVVDGQRVIHLSGTRLPGIVAGPMEQLEFIATDGGADSTVLAIETFEWNGSDVPTTMVNGLFRLQTEPASPPLMIALGPHYPNPVTSSVEIRYALIEEGATRLTLTDVSGRYITTLVDGSMSPGEYITRFETNGIAAGLYFLVLETPTARLTRGIVVAR